MSIAANQHFTLNASYCEKHYLSGVLLQEVRATLYQLYQTLCDCTLLSQPYSHISLSLSLQVEAAIKSGSLLIRKKAIMILRNLMAKHESDDRYSLPVSHGNTHTIVQQNTSWLHTLLQYQCSNIVQQYLFPSAYYLLLFIGSESSCCLPLSPTDYHGDGLSGQATVERGRER